MLNIQRLFHGLLRLRAKESKYVLASVVVVLLYIMLVKVRFVSPPMELSISDPVSKTSLSIKDRTDMFLQNIYLVEKAKMEEKNGKSRSKNVEIEESEKANEDDSTDSDNEDPNNREGL